MEQPTQIVVIRPMAVARWILMGQLLAVIIWKTPVLETIATFMSWGYVVIFALAATWSLAIMVLLHFKRGARDENAEELAAMLQTTQTSNYVWQEFWSTIALAALLDLAKTPECSFNLQAAIYVGVAAVLIVVRQFCNFEVDRSN